MTAGIILKRGYELIRQQGGFKAVYNKPVIPVHLPKNREIKYAKQTETLNLTALYNVKGD